MASTSPKRTVPDLFIKAVPNQLVHCGVGLADTSTLTAFQPPRHRSDEIEVRRALKLVDHAGRKWSAEAIDPTQTTIADWVAQLPRADSPEAAGHLSGYLSTAKSATASQTGRHAILRASLAADAAREIVDDIPADNYEALTRVAEHAAGALAGWAIETNQADYGIGEAVATAEMLAAIE